MLLKLRGTFKVRLFQGSDWPDKNKPASGDSGSKNSDGNVHGEWLCVCLLSYAFVYSFDGI